MDGKGAAGYKSAKSASPVLDIVCSNVTAYFLEVPGPCAEGRSGPWEISELYAAGLLASSDA